ncbi:MAG TPA: hypothetical protein VJ717_07655 [Gemmatimonadaceae bacterium]|nr:hypothetical protein [Gemmatimonadaceae bacterium]
MSALFAASHTALGQRARIHTHGLFLGVGATQMTLESEVMRPPDDGQLGVAGRIGYGFGDYLALVVTGDLARTDLTLNSEESDFEVAQIALGARLHPLRAWGRLGPYVEGSWLRYAATTDRVIAPATAASRVTLEGTGAAAAAGLHLFVGRRLSVELSAAWSDGKLTKAIGSGADGDFSPVDLQSRLYRIGLTWWLGT